MLRTQDNHRRILGTTAVAALALGIAPAAHAGWMVIDDFEAYDASEAGEPLTEVQSPWVAHEDSTSAGAFREEDGNQFLGYGLGGDSRRSVSRELPEWAHWGEGDGTATYFMRFRTASLGDGGNQNLHFGLAPPNVDTDDDSPWGDRMAAPTVARDGDNNTDFQFDLRKQGNVTLIENGINADTWYNFWIVANRQDAANDSWDLYMTTGQDDATTDDLVVSGVDFWQEGEDIASFLGIGYQGDSDPYGQNIDDLGFSEGENLTFIPEPGSAALLAAGAGFMMLRRRR